MFFIFIRLKIDRKNIIVQQQRKEELFGMKHVLCLLRTLEPELFTEILVCAKKYDWILEISGSWLGPGWFGDGIITDYFTIEELSFIQNINSIPIVSREVHTEPNIRSVIGDTNKIAELVYQHFSDKGYKNFAAIQSREWDGGLPDIPHDPIKAYQNLLEKSKCPASPIWI